MNKSSAPNRWSLSEGGRSRLPAAISGLILMLIVGGFVVWMLTLCESGGRTVSADDADSLPDTLRIVTTYGSTTYFNYKGEEMGYEYELAQLFADSLGIPYRLIVAPNATEMLAAIDSGFADLCITPQAMTVSGKSKYSYVGHETQSGLVLVQRNVPKDSILTSTTALIGRTITVPAGTRYAERLNRLNDELGGGVDSVIMRGDTVTTEDLIADVSEGSIAYTIADERLAKLSRTYYPNLNIDLGVGFSQRLFWVIRRDRVALGQAINRLAAIIPKGEAYRNIYKRYFELSKNTDEDGDLVEETPPKSTPNNKASHSESSAHRMMPGDLSPFDHLFKHEAQRLGWPWQILAGIAYHESRYKPRVVGWSGARGLMGIMPATGRRFGASKEQLLDPQISVRVSVDVLIATRTAIGQIPNEEERMKLTLAGYNAGVGHVQDAMRLARKYGHDPNRWEGNVETYIRLKSEPAYYNDPVCRSGYLRGRETIRYVRNVMNHYHTHHPR